MISCHKNTQVYIPITFCWNSIFSSLLGEISFNISIKDTRATSSRSRCKLFLKFRNIHRKRFLLKFYFNKVAGLQACNFIKKRLQHTVFILWISQNFHLQHFLLWKTSTNGCFRSSLAHLVPLTHFMPLISFYTSGNHEKKFGFIMFSVRCRMDVFWKCNKKKLVKFTFNIAFHFRYSLVRR